jgi:hypothetical protein
MIYISILLFFIFFLLKKNIISYTNVNIFNNAPNNNKTSIINGILCTSIFIFILYILEKLFSTEFANIANYSYIIIILLYCTTLLLIISFSYRKKGVYLLCICLFCLISSLFYKSIKEPTIQIKNEKLIINTLSTYIIELKDIDSIWTSEKKFNINKKITGIDLANYYRGKFIIDNRKNSDLLIINKLSKPFLHLQLKNNTQIIFNNSDKNKTLQNLQIIKQSLNKSK